jgi:hypothetical protein
VDIQTIKSLVKFRLLETQKECLLQKLKDIFDKEENGLG